MIKWLRENSFGIATVIGCICVVAFCVWGINRIMITPEDWTYEQCMMKKMHNRPSSMHEIVSEYCKREAK